MPVQPRIGTYDAIETPNIAMTQIRKITARAPAAKGFTLIELMITVVVVAILAAIALPSYQEYIMRARRTEGMGLLHEAAARQERYRAQNGTYADTVSKLGMQEQSENKHYKLVIVDTGYALRADGQNAQAKDKKCGNLSLNSKGVKGVSGSDSAANCWR